MQTIRMTTLVRAPVERCFRLSLSVELHLASVGGGERVIDGVRTGLLHSGEMVTWSGRHFGLRLRHTSVIDGWRPYAYFRDSMVRGMFASFVHEHHFATMDDGTRIRDELRFTAPLGALGRMVERAALRGHLVRMLRRRNAFLRRVAESDEWRRYLDGQPALERHG